MLRILTVCCYLFVQACWAQTITFGIVPQQSASRLASQWTPIMQYLSEKSGKEFIFETAPDIPTFEKRLSNGEYDFAYMNPYHYTIFSESPGYEAVARAKDKKIKGLIVVKKGSGISKVEQLKGEDLAFPSPAAFAASILTRDYLIQKNIEFTPSYVSSHDSVYLAVAKGLYPAGGGIIRTFNAIDESVREQLIPLWVTKGFTPHAIAAHPRVELQLVEEVTVLLEALDTNPIGKKQLSSLNIKGFISAHDNDWDDVRALHINIIQ